MKHVLRFLKENYFSPSLKNSGWVEIFWFNRILTDYYLICLTFTSGIYDRKSKGVAKMRNLLSPYYGWVSDSVLLCLEIQFVQAKQKALSHTLLPA